MKFTILQGHLLFIVFVYRKINSDKYRRLGGITSLQNIIYMKFLLYNMDDTENN